MPLDIGFLFSEPFRRYLIAILIVSIGIVTFTILSGDGGDYALYIMQWAAMIQTGDPWILEHNGKDIPGNAYGPLHGLLGYLLPVYWLGPKLVLVASTLLSFFVIVAHAAKHGDLNDRTFVAGLFILPLCPMVFFSSYDAGGNDGFAALCVGLACIARHHRWFALTGALLAVGALMKFYPLLFAPLFAIDSKRVVHLRLLVVCAGVFLLAMLASYAVWGESILTPFTFSGEREAKGLSILRFMQPLDSMPTFAPFYGFLLDTNTLTVAAFAALFAIFASVSNMDWRISTLVGILLIFAIYKVGHSVFLMSWLTVILFLNFDTEKSLRNDVVRASVPIIVYISVLKIGYMLTGGVDDRGWTGSWEFVRLYMSVPYVVMIGYFLYALRHHLRPQEVRFPTLRF